MARKWKKKKQEIFINTWFSDKPGLFGTTTACEAD